MKLSARFRRWRNRTTIRTQLSLVVSAAVLLLCALLILYSYLAQQRANTRHERASMERVLELERQQLDTYVDGLKDFSLQLRNDSDFMSVLARRDAVGYADQQTLENAFRTQFYGRHDVLWMELYLPRAGLLLRMDNPRRKVVRLDYRAPESLPDYDTFSAAPGYLSILPGEGGFLQVTRTIIDSPRTTPLAVVRFLVDYTLPDRFFRRHAENDERLYLFDASGAAFTDGAGEDEVLEAVRAGRSDITLDGKAQLLACAGPEGAGITVAAVKPLSAVNASLVRTRNVTIGIGVAALIVITLLLLGLIHVLTRPLEALAARMRRAGAGEFKERADLQGSSEMIGLSEDVNRMMENLSELIDRTYVASLNERTAQLAALEAQTNPHFLFNTLQAISTEAILAEDQKVYRMITTLASLLRYTIKGGNLSALSTEIEYVGKYLSIQKARFGERLQYALDADEALLPRRVPKLGLLALVENSIVHGMQGDVDAVSLSIACRVEGGDAVILVRDDGAGIPPERLRQLRESLEDGTVVVLQNIGIGNLASRLRLLYSGRAKLEIESRAVPSRETTVCIRIPMEVLEHVQDADH